MKKFAILVFLLVLGIYTNAQTTKRNCDKSKSTITYSMNHALHAWTGENKDVTSIALVDKEQNIVSVAVKVALANFDSKNANRDSHMIEILEGLKYPTISFVSTLIKQENDKTVVTGTLNFHGVNQTITFAIDKKTIENKIVVTGNFSVKMSQFKIEQPTLLGIKTDDEIKVNFNVVY